MWYQNTEHTHKAIFLPSQPQTTGADMSGRQPDRRNLSTQNRFPRRHALSICWFCGELLFCKQLFHTQQTYFIIAALNGFSAK